MLENIRDKMSAVPNPGADLQRENLAVLQEELNREGERWESLIKRNEALLTENQQQATDKLLQKMDVLQNQMGPQFEQGEKKMGEVLSTLKNLNSVPAMVETLVSDNFPGLKRNLTEQFRTLKEQQRAISGTLKTKLGENDKLEFERHFQGLSGLLEKLLTGVEERQKQDLAPFKQIVQDEVRRQDKETRAAFSEKLSSMQQVIVDNVAADTLRIMYGQVVGEGEEGKLPLADRVRGNVSRQLHDFLEQLEPEELSFFNTEGGKEKLPLGGARKRRSETFLATPARRERVPSVDDKEQGLEPLAHSSAIKTRQSLAVPVIRRQPLEEIEEGPPTPPARPPILFDHTSPLEISGNEDTMISPREYEKQQRILGQQRENLLSGEPKAVSFPQLRPNNIKTLSDMPPESRKSFEDLIDPSEAPVPELIESFQRFAERPKGTPLVKPRRKK